MGVKSTWELTRHSAIQRATDLDIAKYTTVVISQHRHAAVYIGGMLVHLCEIDENLMEDIRNRDIKGKMDAGRRYKQIPRALD